MIRNSHLLKTLLTTVSTLAITMGAESAAWAAAVQSSTFNPTHTGGGAWSPSGTDALVSGNSIILTSANQVIDVNAASPATIAAIDANNYALSGAGIAVNSGWATEISIGSIGNAASGSMPLSIVDGIFGSSTPNYVKITLTGTQSVGYTPGSGVGANDYSALGPVTIGSTTGGTGTPSALYVTATGAVTFTNTFDSFTGATANWGTLNISGANHVFNGVLGGTSKLGAIYISDASNITFGNNVTATSITLQNAASAITLTGGTITTDILASSNSTTAVNINGNATIAGSLGATATHLSAINFSSGSNTLTVDSTAASRSITGAINGVGGSYGNLLLQGSGAGHNIDIYDQIGATHAISGITVNNASGSTITFHGNVHTTGNIDASGAGSTVSFSSNVTSDTGHFLTSQSSFSSITGDVSVGGHITLGNNTSFAGNITAAGGINLGSYALTLAPVFMGGKTITANIAGGTGSIVNISNNPVTLTGNVGSLGAAIGGVNFSTNTTLTVSGVSSIYAPITTSNTGGSGTLGVTGGNSSIYDDIGTSSHQVSILKITDGSTLSVTGNLYVYNIRLDNSAAQLKILGGTSGAPNVVLGTISNTAGSNSRGLVIVGDGTSASYVNFVGYIGNGSGQAAQLLTVVGSATASNASSATISGDSCFDGSSGGTSGILIGQNATLTVTRGMGFPQYLSLANGATIQGIVAGSGTYIQMGGTLPPVAIGSSTSLGTVRLNNFNAGTPAVLNAAVHATTLDLTNSSVVILDPSVASTNITNFTTTDSSSAIDFTPTAGADLAVGNIGIPLSIYNTTYKLTIAGSTAATTFVAANGTLIAANGASVSDVLAGGGIYGTLENAGNATFVGAIGSGTYSLAALTLTGTAANTVGITTATDVYASSITHHDIMLDTSARNIMMHGSYSAHNAALNLGNKTLNIAAGEAAILTGTFVINATYTGTTNPALDLSGATSVDASGVTALTLNINNGGLTPAQNASMTVIKFPTSGVIPPVSMITSMGISDPKWQMTSLGTLIYTPPAPAVGFSLSTPTMSSGFSPVGATASDIIAAAPVLGSNGVNITGNGTIPLTILSNGQPVFNLPTSLAADLMKQTDIVKLGAFGSMGHTISNQPSVLLPQNTINTIATLGAGLGIIPQNITDSIINTTVSGISTDTAASIVGVAATGGKEAVTDLATRVNSSAEHSATTLSLLSTRLSLTSHAVQNALNDDGIFATAEGAAAGDSPYDKFGMWGSINIGRATQKLRKSNPGFKSISKGAAIGADTMINDRTTVGFSVSNSMSDIKFKDTASGSKTDTSSWIGAIYSNHQFRDNWFVRGTALINNTHINSKSLRRITANSYGIAQAKYNMLSYGGDAVLGFAHRLTNRVILTPTVGMRILHNNKISYREKGSTAQNISTTQKAMNNYSALFGLSAAKTFVKYGINITPEAYINGQYGINTKGPQGSFVSPINPNTTTNFVGTSPSKLFTTYGLGITGSSDRIECSITTDATVGDKYVGYQGTLKLKVKF